MHQSVDGSDGHAGVIEQRVPILERLIRRNDHAAAFIPVGDEFEQDTGFLLGLADVADVIDDEYRVQIQNIE